MKSNAYIKRLIKSYSESEKKYSIIEILKDLEMRGKYSKLGYLISKEAAERLRQAGLAPYDRKNEDKLYQAILDILYEKTDLIDVLELLNLDTSNVDKQVLKEAKNIIGRNWRLIEKILEGRGGSKISTTITEDEIRELVQRRRTYSSSAGKFIKELGFAIALISAIGKAKGAAHEINPHITADPKHRIEFVTDYAYDKTEEQIIIEEFRSKVDILKLREGFANFYKSLKIGNVPKDDRLLMLLYKRAVFYTQHINFFNSKFGNSKSMYATLLTYGQNNEKDIYIATVRDLFIASVAGGALERVWEIMNHHDFTDEEIDAITVALSTHTYTVKFRQVQSNDTTTNFSNVITIEIPLKNNQLAEFTIKIEGLSTFDYESLKSKGGDIARRLRSNFVTAHIEDSITDTYGFYMILPNGVNTTTNTIHYLGILFRVNVKVHKVLKAAASDSASSTMGMAKLKSKNSRMFRRRKKYEWM